MSPQQNLSVAESLASLSEQQREQIYQELTEDEALALLNDWDFWARTNQRMPEGIWRYWLILAGRGFGKTRTGAETVRTWVDKGYRRIHLIGPTVGDTRNVMVTGPSGLLSCFPAHQKPDYQPSKHLIVFHTGAIAETFSADEPERLRGPQCEAFWADEPCLIAGTEVYTQHGAKAIENILYGDLVWTRAGLRRVLKAGMTARAATVYRVTCSDGRLLIGTARHPVFSNGTFVPLLDLIHGDTLEVWSSAWNGVVESGGSTVEDTGCLGMAGCSTAKSGRRLTEQSQRESRSITETAISSTSISRTSRRFQQSSITANIRLEAGTALLTRKLDPRMPSSNGGKPSRASTPATNAANHSRALDSGRDSVVQPVTVVSIERLEQRQPGYNLEVEDTHEYYANGILTHNCAWRFLDDAWDNLMFGFRLGDDPRGVISTTPKPSKWLKSLMQNRMTHVTRGSSYDNRANLAPAFFEDILKKYEGTRIGRQEINAEVLEDVPGALWTRALIDATRVRPSEMRWDLIVRTVIAIDPAVSATDESDETGINVACISRSGHVIVLDDLTCRESPLGWATIVKAAYHARRADRVVAEVNNGGELVERNIRALDNTIAFRAVRASRGKYTRAEPVAALYERGMVHHLGSFQALEDQMCSFVPGSQERSPDRLDALVWAITDLVIDPMEQGYTVMQPIEVISPI